MKAAIVTDEQGLNIVELPDPAPGPGDLVLRVTACGICGSDFKAVHSLPRGTVPARQGPVVRITPALEQNAALAVHHHCHCRATHHE
jgi:(R,R)-butanediol dehydrogenase/meso-butanediol dehydrogenase/diacetyl reductase